MRLLPRSLFGRLALLLLGGLILAQLLSVYILLQDRGQLIYRSHRQALIERTAGIVRLLDSLPSAERRRLVPLLSGPDLRVTLAARPAPGEAGAGPAAERVRRQLMARLGAPATVRVAVAGPGMADVMPRMHRRMMGGMRGPGGGMPGGHVMARLFDIQVQLKDGSWVRFQRGLPEQLFALPVRLLSVLGVLLVSVILLSLIGVRLIVRPLRELRQAAEGLGRDIRRPPLDERGPTEVRETARAFNTMQARLQNYIEDRAGILAAVSHDLKTPLTRIRLRTDLMEDEALRDRIQRDLDDMEAMVNATLDFMRGTETGEASRPMDLMALLESIREDAREAGGAVRLLGALQGTFEGKPLALKRCLTNLVENALRYGGGAEIQVAGEGEEIVIAVCDRGPGIPETARQKVFEPFFRLEGSRAEHTGGTGLGLGIARNIARAHGGELTLHPRPGGGLCARLSLPR